MNNNNTQLGIDRSNDSIAYFVVVTIFSLKPFASNLCEEAQKKRWISTDDEFRTEIDLLEHACEKLNKSVIFWKKKNWNHNELKTKCPFRIRSVSLESWHSDDARFLSIRIAKKMLLMHVNQVHITWSGISPMLFRYIIVFTSTKATNDINFWIIETAHQNWKNSIGKPSRNQITVICLCRHEDCGSRSGAAFIQTKSN